MGHVELHRHVSAGRHTRHADSAVGRAERNQSLCSASRSVYGQAEQQQERRVCTDLHVPILSAMLAPRPGPRGNGGSALSDSDEFYPCSFVIFGATGHLSATKLLPALYDLEAAGRLPEVTNFIAFGRREHDDASWARQME